MSKDVHIRWWETLVDDHEVAAIAEAVRGRNISQGAVTAKFEEEFAALVGVPYALATTSCTMALTLSYMALGIGPGDEVIVPNRTFIATAHAALILGARVVLVDTRRDLPLLDVDLVASKITSRTKAIVPVHLNGRAVDMRKLIEIARHHNVCIVEDAAQAALSKHRGDFLGTIGDIGCYSLGMTKLFSSGQGGVVVTRDRELFQRLRLLRNQGVSDVFQTTFDQQGFNAKFTDLQAAVARVQLERAQEKREGVLSIHRKYVDGIKDLSFLKIVPVNDEEGEIPLWVEVLATNRDRLQTFLSERGIETRRFLPDLHLSPHLVQGGEFVNSRMFDLHGLFLPCGPAQSLAAVEAVLEALTEYASYFPDETR